MRGEMWNLINLLMTSTAGNLKEGDTKEIFIVDVNHFATTFMNVVKFEDPYISMTEADFYNKIMKEFVCDHNSAKVHYNFTDLFEFFENISWLGGELIKIVELELQKSKKLQESLYLKSILFDIDHKTTENNLDTKRSIKKLIRAISREVDENMKQTSPSSISSPETINLKYKNLFVFTNKKIHRLDSTDSNSESQNIYNITPTTRKKRRLKSRNEEPNAYDDALDEKNLIYSKDKDIQFPFDTLLDQEKINMTNKYPNYHRTLDEKLISKNRRFCENKTNKKSNYRRPHGYFLDKEITDSFKNFLYEFNNIISRVLIRINFWIEYQYFLNDQKYNEDINLNDVFCNFKEKTEQNNLTSYDIEHFIKNNTEFFNFLLSRYNLKDRITECCFLYQPNKIKTSNTDWNNSIKALQHYKITSNILHWHCYNLLRVDHGNISTFLYNPFVDAVSIFLNLAFEKVFLEFDDREMRKIYLYVDKYYERYVFRLGISYTNLSSNQDLDKNPKKDYDLINREITNPIEIDKFKANFNDCVSGENITKNTSNFDDFRPEILKINTGSETLPKKVNFLENKLKNQIEVANKSFLESFEWIEGCNYSEIQTTACSNKIKNHNGYVSATPKYIEPENYDSFEKYAISIDKNTISGFSDPKSKNYLFDQISDDISMYQNSELDNYLTNFLICNRHKEKMCEDCLRDKQYLIIQSKIINENPIYDENKLEGSSRFEAYVDYNKNIESLDNRIKNLTPLEMLIDGNDLLKMDRTKIEKHKNEIYICNFLSFLNKNNRLFFAPKNFKNTKLKIKNTIDKIDIENFLYMEFELESIFNS